MTKPVKCGFLGGDFLRRPMLFWMVGFLLILTMVMNDFDFIECFTTTFLRAHSWLNWVDEDDDEDEVGLKEKPEDTRYIKKITSK